MKILHVNKFIYRRGGAEGYMMDVAAIQRRMGHDVELFGMEHHENVPTRYSEYFPSYVEFGAERASVPQRIELTGRMLYSKSARVGMAAVLDDFEPDVVHLNNIYHQLSPSILSPIRKRGIRSVLTLHDYKLACPTYQFLADGEICQACLGGKFSNAVRKRCNRGSLAASLASATELAIHTNLSLYGSVDLFLCPSSFLKDQMEAAGVFPDRLRHNPNFVDIGETYAADAPGHGVVYFGRLSYEKGIDVLIDAVAAIGEPLRIAGTGPAEQTLKSRAERSGADIEFLGRLPKEALHDVVRASRVSVLPARWYENQPLSVLESYACGVPVVASSLGGLPEIVIDGETGALVPHNDVAALSSALSRYVDDEAMAYQHGRAGRTLVEGVYSPEAHIERLFDLYDEARQPRDRRATSK